MTDAYTQNELLQISNRVQSDIYFGLEVAFVVANETSELDSQILDGVELGLRVDRKLIHLSHGLASRDILDPLAVVDNIRYLNGSFTVHLTKDCVHKRYMLDHQWDVVDVDPIANIVGGFDEDEDAGAEEFLDSACDGKGESGNATPQCRNTRGEGCVEKCD